MFAFGSSHCLSCVLRNTSLNCHWHRVFVSSEGTLHEVGARLCCAPSGHRIHGAKRWHKQGAKDLTVSVRFLCQVFTLQNLGCRAHRGAACIFELARTTGSTCVDGSAFTFGCVALRGADYLQSLHHLFALFLLAMTSNLESTAYPY